MVQNGPFRRPRILSLLSDADYMQLGYHRGLRDAQICSQAAG